MNAAKPPVQTSHHSTKPTYTPDVMNTASHVYVRKGKPTTLGQNYDGPYKIVEHLGTSSVKVRVGAYTGSGKPRFEVHHWNNCKIADFFDEPFEAQRPALGRKPKRPVLSSEVHGSDENVEGAPAKLELPNYPITRQH